MYNTAYFSRIPSSRLPATRSKQPQIAVGTSLHGEIIPLFCNLVMPGQIDSNRLIGKIEMSTPIAPLMSQIKGSINVFFVPLRLVWDNCKRFFGENDTTAGPQTLTNFSVPGHEINIGVQSGVASGYNSNVVVGSVSHYLHRPLKKSGDQYTSGVPNQKVNILKERAYWLCVSEYYRHEQVMNPVLLDKDDTGKIGTLNGTVLDRSSMPQKCLKDFDYFTTATISPNYDSVLIPLGSVAPVITMTQKQSFDSTPAPLTMYSSSTISGDKIMGVDGGNGKVGAYNGNPGSGASFLTPDNLYADLSRAVGSKLDDLYTAMAAEAWYHNANYGSRYFEAMEIHFSVTNPDLVMQRPEHIAEFKFDIAIQDLIATAAGDNGDSTTELGQRGASSITYLDKKIYTHSFGEWGYVIALFNTYHQRYYSAGVAREDLYQNIFDFYWPEFANRGDDSIFFNEVYYTPTLDGTKSFAFQEAYADRRYYQATATGQLDPYCDSSVNGKNKIAPFVLAEKWTNRPSFGSQFLLEDRLAIADALVTGQNGPDYVWAFNFIHTETKPMPAHSKPGIPLFGRGLI